MMKWVFSLLTAVFLSTASQAQLGITATTDTTLYGFEQPIGIYITAHNAGSQPVNLQWLTACQSEYWIDQYYSQTSIGCAQILTSLTLAPDSSHTWSRVHQSNQYQLTPGYHTVIGGVIDYGQAQPISIQVEPPISITGQEKIPVEFHLTQNYPNPFNPTTTIVYQIPILSFVTIKVYDVLGSEIATLVNEELPVGSYEIEFNATALPSGIYFYRIQAGEFIQTKKMVLLR